jgi:hypothetical protein
MGCIWPIVLSVGQGAGCAVCWLADVANTLAWPLADGSVSHLSSVSLFSLQRDLDFTIDLDFKGQLCELSCSTDYRMR